MASITMEMAERTKSATISWRSDSRIAGAAGLCGSPNLFHRHFGRAAHRLRVFLLLGRAHAVEHLPDQAQGVDLVVMLAERECQQLSAKVGIPRRLGRDIQTFLRHAATD